MLQKTIEISVLYDYYNQLLTEKQSDIIDLYYNQDLSLGETSCLRYVKENRKVIISVRRKIGFYRIAENKKSKDFKNIR